MACLHRFVPHPTQELLYCECCAIVRPFAAAAKAEKPKVVKTDDVEKAVAKFLEEKLAQAPEPVQENLFHTPVVEMGDEIYAAHLANIEAAQQRADRNARDDGAMPDGYFDANQPGEKQWVGP